MGRWCNGNICASKALRSGFKSLAAWSNKLAWLTKMYKAPLQQMRRLCQYKGMV